MHWVWTVEPEADAEAMIYGESAALAELDVTFEEGLAVGPALPPSIEIVRGRDVPGALTEHLHVSGVDALLFSFRLRQVLAEIPVETVQYWPAVLHNPADGTRSVDYQLANIVGRVSCLDRENSVLELAPDDPNIVEFIDVLAIDEEKARGFDLFRLHEDPEFIIASDRVKDACERHRITGLRFYQPEEYPY